jgi:putative ABC transport system permease protein
VIAVRNDLWWRNLVDRKMRLFLRVAAIAFPIMLIFVQIGFYDAVLKTATVIQESLNADLFLVSSAYINISRAGTFPRARLYQAASVASVERVAPLYVGHRAYQNPVTLDRRELLVFGIDPEQRTFRLAEVSDHLHALTVPDTVLIDRNSRPEFGPQQPGTMTQVERKRVEIVGQYTIGTGFAAIGDLIATDLTFSRIFDGRTLERVSVGLVQAAPGSDVRAIAVGIRALLPPDTRALTRAEMFDLEEKFWLRTTSIGLIFGLGTAVAFAVGFLILYQVLSSDIARQLSEYATLKALGYDDRALATIVVWQGFAIAFASFTPALLLALWIYRVTRSATHLPMVMNVGRVGGVLFLTLAMSAASGWLALRKLRSANPVDLFSAQT